MQPMLTSSVSSLANRSPGPGTTNLDYLVDFSTIDSDGNDTDDSFDNIENEKEVRINS